MTRKSQINIQKEIEKILDTEFKEIIREHANDPLFNLVKEGKLADMTLEEIRNAVGGE